MKRLITLLASLLLTQNAYAEEVKKTDDDWKFKGQILTRGELDGRDFNNQTLPLGYILMRSRLSVEKSLFDKMDFMLQMQDSRILGEEGNPVFNLKNIDLHQGFVNFKNVLPFDVQVGRFEMAYGTERFIGPVAGWNYIGRSFDGVRLKYKNENFNFKTDAFGLIINPQIKSVSSPSPKVYPANPEADTSFGMYGFWSSAEVNPNHKFDLFAYYEDNRKQTKVGFNDLSRLNLGVNYKGKFTDNLSSIIELGFQKGKVSDLDVTAYLLSLQGYYRVNDFKFALGTDILSGNNPASKTTNNTFAVPYGTNHPYYGFMDYFINIPDATGNLGLNDYYFRTYWENENNPLSLRFDIHHFMSNQPSVNNESIYGQEADLVLTYKLFQNTNISYGLSGFLPGNLMKSDKFFGSKRTDLSYWSYVMFIVNF